MIKKILCLSLAILLIGGVAHAVDYGKVVVEGQGGQVSSGYRAGHGQGDVMGQGKYDSQPHRTYRFVRYVPPPVAITNWGMDNLLDIIVSKDSIVVWCTGVSGDDGVTVTLTYVSQDTSVAGILACDALPPVSTDTISGAAADVGKRNWAWIQTYGKAVAFHADTGEDAAAGYGFGTSQVTGEIDIYKVTSDSKGTWTTQAEATMADHLGIAGFYYDADTTKTNVEVFLTLE